MKKILSTLFITLLMAAGLVSCDEEQNFAKMPPGKYYISLAYTINDVTTYYVVNTNDLMSGTITARAQGLEQTGYRDFVQNGNTLYSIGDGRMGSADCNVLTMSPTGTLTEAGNFVFIKKLEGLSVIDDRHMIAMEQPQAQIPGQHLFFYLIDGDHITSTVKDTPVSPTDDGLLKKDKNGEDSLDINWWPTTTGIEYSGGKVYVSYYPMHPLNCFTPDEDTARVAVYSYPDMKFITLMKDDRIGAAGSFNAFNGLIKDERGDIYVMSNTSISNGFDHNGERPAGFLRIKSGETTFAPDYQYNFMEKSGGLRPAHIKYIGNGKALVEYSTVKEPVNLGYNAGTDLWKDRDLKVAVVDLWNMEFHDVPDVPVHDGGGARHFVALTEGNYVYIQVPVKDKGLFIYRVDTENYTAKQGAPIEASFLGGIFSAK